MSTVATSARLNVNAGSPYAKHNGLIFPIAYHLANAVCLELPHGPYTVQTDFNLAEVELLGERPAHLVQPFDAEDFPAEFETEQSCWEGTHTSYVWQKSADYEKIVGETPKFYKVATLDLHAQPMVRRVAKTKLRFKAPAAAPVAEVPTIAPGIDGAPTTRLQLQENAGFVDAEPTAEGAGGWVTIYVAAKQGIDTAGAEFAVVCECHGNIGAAATYGLACRLMGQPALFCVDCQNGALADDEAPRELAEPADISAGLLPWQRAALLDMCAGPETPADVRALLQACSDEQLVLAAGFAPMLPALLHTWLPAGHPALPAEQPVRRDGPLDEPALPVVAPNSPYYPPAEPLADSEATRRLTEATAGLLIRAGSPRVLVIGDVVGEALLHAAGLAGFVRRPTQMLFCNYPAAPEAGKSAGWYALMHSQGRYVVQGHSYLTNWIRRKELCEALAAAEAAQLQPELPLS